MTNFGQIMRQSVREEKKKPNMREERTMANDRRPEDMVRITTPELADAFIEEQVKALRE